ncbi:hypothetical protein [Flavobacterium eburneipallidum]|uniref:hypothetical protein n=1 Tax=Flavobacterium eburneipallidum TaxID=3003263 RepID=UPI002482F802|nr:hypothetical protein [Flavobacterium eburneipallidum]
MEFAKNEKYINKVTLTSFVLIGVSIFGFAIIFFQLLYLDNKPENFGVVGDAIGGILNPLIAIAASFVTFLAFYIQKQANDEIRQQFIDQSNKEFDDFLYKKYSDKINLISNEINNYFFTFSEYTKPNSKRNFNGIQAIIETFNIYTKESKEVNYSTLKKEDIDVKMQEIYSIFSFYYLNLDKINNLCFSKREGKDKNEYGIKLREDLIDNMFFIYNAKIQFIKHLSL